MNRLAHLLIEKYGVGCEERVSIEVERTASWVISVLGILKAGGAYVPLDPAQPEHRRALIVEQAQPRVCIQLGQKHALAREQGSACASLSFAQEWEGLAHYEKQAPASEVRPDQLAYVIYTSGSTGEPKGVMVEHGGVGHLGREQGKAFGVKRGAECFSSPRQVLMPQWRNWW